MDDGADGCWWMMRREERNGVAREFEGASRARQGRRVRAKAAARRLRVASKPALTVSGISQDTQPHSPRPSPLLCIGTYCTFCTGRAGLLCLRESKPSDIRRGAFETSVTDNTKSTVRALELDRGRWIMSSNTSSNNNTFTVNKGTRRAHSVVCRNYQFPSLHLRLRLRSRPLIRLDGSEAEFNN